MKKKVKTLIKGMIIGSVISLLPLAVNHGYKKYVRSHIKDNVVAFKSPESGRTYGTGFHIKWNGKVYILTNKHICNVRNYLHEGRMELQANDKLVKILKIYDKHDLCLLEPIKDTGLDISDTEPEVWDKVLLVGHPRGLKPTFREGRLIDRTAPVCLLDQGCLIAYQISATAYPGNSGSPVTDYRGNVIGVLFAGSPAYPHEPFTVPLSAILDFLKSIK